MRNVHHKLTFVAVWVVGLSLNHVASVFAQRYDLEIARQTFETVDVETTVTSISGNSVFVDQGRDGGLQVGGEIAFELENGDRLVLMIDSVSRSSARCPLPESGASVSIGVRGTAKVNRPMISNDPSESSAKEPAPTPTVDQPPKLPAVWTRPPEQWNSELPLLAEAKPLKSHERDVEIHGQIFSQYLNTWNWQFVDNQYSLARFGTDFWIENPFQRGGGIHFRGDFDWRGTDIFDGFGQSNTFGRIDLLSYYGRGNLNRPFRFEMGRFLPDNFPEFGFLDGADFSMQATERSRLGFAVGALPEPFPSLQSGEDLQAAVTYGFCADPDEKFTFDVGYQKTWHLGNPDRDLIVTKADFCPNRNFNAYVTLWTDYYGNHDTLKPNGLQITEAIYNQHLFLSPRLGMGTYYTQIRWPQLLRREIDPIFALQVIRNRRRNYGGHVWFDASSRLRINGRIDRWENEDAFGGTTWETEVVVRGVLNAPLDLTVAYLTTDGIYSSGPGGRVGLAHYFSRGLASLTYTVGDYRLTQETDKLIHQALMASLDFYNLNGRSFSLYGDYRFGEAQDAASLGLIWRQRIK